MSLSPGERIDLKKRIAATLSEQARKDIDLTLEEFGLPTQVGGWGGLRESYVLEMLKGQGEALLVQLDSYLHPSAVAAASPQPAAFDDPSSPWAGTGLRLFLSHEHEHASQAALLREELSKRSVDAFVAHDSIEPTEEWEQVILAALRSCDACVALLTPEFAGSKWCDQEVGFCIARHKLVIPLEFGATPYGFLARYQALAVTGKQLSNVSLSIFELLVRKPQSRDAMARALVSRWVDTTSWQGARENYGFLRTIPTEAWTQQLVNEVWAAAEGVHDLRTAWIESFDSSEAAVEHLFSELHFERPPKPESDDDIPF